MTIILTDKKKRQLKSFCTNILLVTTTNIGTATSILGKITSSFPAANLADLERCKTAALSKHRGNYKAKTSPTDKAQHDLIWWRDNITHVPHNIVISSPDRCIRIDASSYG